MSEPLLNTDQLAKALSVSDYVVTAMKRAGYEMQYKAIGKTTLSHALKALERAPDFVANHYRQKAWAKLPKLLAEPPNPVA